ncbi:MAG TPA: GH116 family glycosyl hydrolase, partial [Verrucomicrobiae bacterium]
EAHIEIVDEATGGWGHITVDQIVFSDWPGDHDVLPLLDALLPIRFSGIQERPKHDGKPAAVLFRNSAFGRGATRSTAKNGLEQFSVPVGKGHVKLLAGQVLNPAENNSARIRQEVYATLCSLVDANYAMSEGQSAREPGYGTLALATLARGATGLTTFDNWDDAWNQFQKDGQFLPLESLGSSSPSPQGQSSYCALAATVLVPAGDSVDVPFLFTWHYPNKYSEAGEWMGCYYATQWRDARAVMRDTLANYDRLYQRTALYRQTFYDSTLPAWLLDAMTANSGILRHIGVVFRIANGDIYGWEGSNGSCQPTCTHVWGYEQSLARLFPDQERSMRRIDFKHQQNPDGGINNRTDVPSPPHPTGERPFTDGHASCILKAYREALNCSDDSFFNSYWPQVKRAMEYLINRDASSNGGKPCGVLADDQWNTYDEALHGVTTFISGYYLAALRAGEEWARRMGDSATADRFHEIFKSGQAKLVELCWNGEYFQQHLPDYLSRSGEVGPGCMADQLLGQWWAHQLGLGYILPRDKVQSALRSIFKYNWKSDLIGFKFAPRSFAGDHDKGLIICTWPRGGRPEKVMNYSDEVWTGIEYQVAAHMIYEGFIEEGFSIAKGARERYDGVPRNPIPRNPWCEIECGGHYTRAMSSWSLLLALSGWKYDGPRGELSFTPSYRPENFKSFFTGPEGWGSVAQHWDGDKQRVKVDVQSGELRVQTLEIVSVRTGAYQPSVTLAGKNVPITFTTDGAHYRLNFGHTRITIKADHALEIVLG